MILRVRDSRQENPSTLHHFCLFRVTLQDKKFLKSVDHLARRSADISVRKQLSIETPIKERER